MSSIIPGYEYDIFISYRQKDNKGDRWVSEFVEALKIELESTFKEEVSVYFDINPHDGLLDTHDVDATLKEKLKCLVFIPIVSQTYCDSKCFAWQNEFVAFNKMAKEDQFGAEIRLASGNVASRILPVKIHSLDPEDNTLLENELGRVLRSIEFIYKSAGVNRPLRANEDHPHDNLNKTYFRDQINKVANAVKEIIAALKKYDPHEHETHQEFVLSKPEKSITLKRKTIFVSSFMLIMIILVYFVIHKLSGSSEPADIRIAVLPFDNYFTDKNYSYLGDQIASEINSQLRDVNKFKVISYNSTRQYIFPNIPSGKQIGKECGANIIVQGSVELINDNKDVIIKVTLSNIINNNSIWHQKFPVKYDSLQSFRSKIILEIAQELQVELSPKEIRQIETGITKSSDAYTNFLSANYQNEAASSFALRGKKYSDSSSYELAIKMYDKAISYDSTFALAYARRSISRSWAFFEGSLTDQSNIEKCKADIDKALKINPKLAEAQNAYGFYYYYCKNEYQKALECFKKASDLDPGNWQSIYYLAMLYRRMGEWTRSKTLMTKVLKYNPNPQDVLILTNIGTSFNYLRNYDSALIYQDMAIKFMPNWASSYTNKIFTLILKNGSTKEARIVIDTAIKKTRYKFQDWKILLDIYDTRYDKALINTEMSDPSDFSDRGDKLLYYAFIHNYLDHSDLAKTYYDSARVFYIKELKEYPDDPTIYSQIGIAWAGLKNAVKAVEAGKKALKLSTDALTRNDKLLELAQIYVIVGDYDNCLRLIDELLKNPSNFSIKLLQLDPVWNPLHEKPEYKKLIEEYTKN